ncbi:protein of unknown function (plasmid) [Cupriavidus taiwanensis]|uniref:Uncharacterized protein n=1 Tax=Cupriavidus taiwanensis TaxID=164546 RepID=A0A7Z7JI62_9BURK|nr:hypothetical protein CBM2598_U40011 [Cupriavidus taiwanensis]SPC26108.1 hypothetical protein CBM2594_U40013 [Cupriavidus taiwanensis]SPD37760.1 protein of unknown function [Cupriavidus taiwanensis]
MRTHEQHGEGWIADNGKLADTECGRCRKVLPDFFLDVLRLFSIGSRAVFFVALLSGNRRVQFSEGSRRMRDRPPYLRVSCRLAGGLTLVRNPDARRSLAPSAGAHRAASEPQPPIEPVSS